MAPNFMKKRQEEDVVKILDDIWGVVTVIPRRRTDIRYEVQDSNKHCIAKFDNLDIAMHVAKTHNLANAVARACTYIQS